jgi:hypothetical protein
MSRFSPVARLVGTVALPCPPPRLSPPRITCAARAPKRCCLDYRGQHPFCFLPFCWASFPVLRSAHAALRPVNDSTLWQRTGTFHPVRRGLRCTSSKGEEPYTGGNRRRCHLAQKPHPRCTNPIDSSQPSWLLLVTPQDMRNGCCVCSCACIVHPDCVRTGCNASRHC